VVEQVSFQLHFISSQIVEVELGLQPVTIMESMVIVSLPLGIFPPCDVTLSMGEAFFLVEESPFHCCWR